MMPRRGRLCAAFGAWHLTEFEIAGYEESRRQSTGFTACFRHGSTPGCASNSPHGRRSRVSWQVNDQRIAKVHSYSKEKVKSLRIRYYAPPASGTAAAVRCDHGLVPVQAFQRWWPGQCGPGGVATTRSSAAVGPVALSWRDDAAAAVGAGVSMATVSPVGWLREAVTVGPRGPVCAVVLSARRRSGSACPGGPARTRRSARAAARPPARPAAPGSCSGWLASPAARPW
jgi:hypothetical protein